MIGHEDLLAAPRGRRFCFELLRQLVDDGSDSRAEPDATLFWATYHLDRRRGTAGTLFGPGADAPAREPSAGRVDASFDGLLRSADRSAATVLHVLRALGETADTAWWWQEPDAIDVLLASPDRAGLVSRMVTACLALPPVFGLLTSGGAAPQWHTRFAGDEGVVDDDRSGLRSARAVSAEWRYALLAEVADGARRRRPAAAAVSGAWWSTPPHGLLTTTAAAGEHGPIGLWAVEDSFGWERASVSAVPTPGSAAVAVIDGPDDWAALCRRASIDVSTTTRRHDWFRATGVDGDWVLPDWVELAEEFDAVHLTVRGWLATGGLAIPVGAGTASVVAGWTPDTTVWLRDPAPAVDQAMSQHWVWDDRGWRRV